MHDAPPWIRQTHTVRAHERRTTTAPQQPRRRIAPPPQRAARRHVSHRSPPHPGGLRRTGRFRTPRAGANAERHQRCRGTQAAHRSLHADTGAGRRLRLVASGHHWRLHASLQPGIQGAPQTRQGQLVVRPVRRPEPPIRHRGPRNSPEVGVPPPVGHRGHPGRRAGDTRTASAGRPDGPDGDQSPKRPTCDLVRRQAPARGRLPRRARPPPSWSQRRTRRTGRRGRGNRHHHQGHILRRLPD